MRSRREVQQGHCGGGEGTPVVAERPYARLTERQCEVLALVGGGLTNQEISKQLYLEMSTVKSHIRQLRLALGARDRVALALVAKARE